MDWLKNLAVGIILGIALVLAGYFFYHVPEVKKAYSEGLEECLQTHTNSSSDTIVVRDTIYTVKQKVVPKIVYKDSMPKLAIDTTVYFQLAGKVRVMSDDIALNGLEIEPIYYDEHTYIIDTIYVDRIKEVPIPEKPRLFIEKPAFLVTAGAVIGGAVVYYLTKK